MPPTASIIVPTAGRPGYLDVTLASVCAQAGALGAEVIVVDDGADVRTREAAERHGTRWVPNDRTPGLNGARNAGIAAAQADLLVWVDDDVEVREGWLAALLAGPPGYGVLTGPIHARFEDHPLRMCGREGPPITFLELGEADTDAEVAWGANMAIRRATLDRHGWFDESHRTGAGDEETWMRAYRAAGGRIRYLAGAALDHRRAGDDARLRSLARAAYARGRTARRYDVSRGESPGAERELRVLLGCVGHTVIRRCANGLVLGAHAAGRLHEAVMGWAGPAAPPAEDFLAAGSGRVAGRRGALRRLADRALDLAAAMTLRGPRLRRAARSLAVRRVLVVGATRRDVTDIAAELGRSRHDVTIDMRAAGDRGKFENLDLILAGHDLATFDWVLAVDDDVALPRGFLDGFLFLAERFGLALAQPAQSLASHAAWDVVRRRPGAVAHTTSFVEIGPVTAFSKATFERLLPFPDLRMAWGLDLHWAAIARDAGWRLGVIDATPVRHEQGAVASGYSREDAVAEARAFLAEHPYLRRDEVATLAVHRRW